MFKWSNLIIGSMRKTTILILVLLQTALLLAQQVPNGDFESWSGGDPVNWNTITQVDHIDQVTGHSGFGAKMETKNVVFVGPAPGLLTLGEFDSGDNSISGGVNFTYKPDSLVGYYRSNIESGDTAAIAAGLFITDNDTVAKATFFVTQSKSTYTRFSVPFEYLQQITPVFLNVAMLSSSAQDRQVGTWLEVDDLEFKYAPIYYDMTVEASPINTGTVGVETANGTEQEPYNFLSGTEITLTATPEPGYNFSSWSINGTTSTNNPHTFNISENTDVVANFVDETIVYYTLTFNSNPASSATYIVTESGIQQNPPYTFESGTEVQIEAAPNQGYAFNHWTINGTDEATNPYTLIVDEDKTITANMDVVGCVSINQFPYTEDFESSDTLPECWDIIDNQGNGQIWEFGSFSTGLSTGANYAYLNSDGYGTGNTQNSDLITCSFDFSSSLNINVSFDHYYQFYNNSQAVFSYSTDEGATWTNIDQWTSTTTSNPAQYNSGTLTELAGESYVLFRFHYYGTFAYHWCIDNFTVSADEGFTLNLIANDNSMGTVSPEGNSVYVSGENVDITAMSNPGYIFSHWEENGNVLSDLPTYNITIDADRTIIGIFEPCSIIDSLPFAETFETEALPGCWTVVDNQGDGEVWEIGTFASGISGATSNYAYINSDGYGSGHIQNTDLISPVFDFTYYTNINLSFTHYYRHYQSTAEVSYSTDGGNTWNSIEVFTADSENPANASYDLTQLNHESSVQFKWTYTGNYDWYWSVDDIAISGVPEYNITAIANPVDGGTITGEGTYAENEQATLTAIPNQDYQFVNWTEDGNEVATDSIYEFTVTGHRDLVANFAMFHTVSLDVQPASTGTVTGEGVYENGESVTVSATPETGYVFESWSSNGTQVSTNADFTFTLTSDTALTANFVQPVTLELMANPVDGGTLTQSGSGTYAPGDQVTITASPIGEYTFVNWTHSGNVLSGQLSYSFTINEDMLITANFQGCDAVNYFPHLEEFETTPDCYSIIDNEGNGEQWAYGDNGEITWATGNYAYIFSEEFGNWTNQNADLITCPFDFTQAATVFVSFNHQFIKSNLTTTTGTFYYSTDDGANWTPIRIWENTIDVSEYFYIELQDLAGEENVRFKWNYLGGSRPLTAGAWFIDDFRIMDMVNNIEQANQNNIYVYPNPAKNMITIAGVNSNTVNKIFDINGKIIKQNTSNVIDISDLPAGIYNITIEVNNKTKSIRFIKE